MGRNIYRLTNPQKAIWLTEAYYRKTAINSICGYVYISDITNLEILKKAIGEMVKSNAAMRIRVREENGIGTQYIEEYKEFSIDTIELKEEKEIEETALRIANKPFFENDNDLFQFIVYKLPNGFGGFIVNVHHLIGDSWSLGLLAKEITSIYAEILKGNYEPKEYPSYINYIEAEENYRNSEKWIKDKTYWEEVFSTVPEIASLIPGKKEAQKEVSCVGKREKFTLSQTDLIQINHFCNQYKISAYNFFMAIYSLYLSRISNLDDFVIGTPILNRTNFEQKHTMGMFISVAPLRIKVNDKLSFIDFAKNIAADTMSIFRHQKYSYQSILEDLRKKDSSIPNLYNVILSYQITKTTEEENGIKYVTDWVFNGNSSDELQIHLFDLNEEGGMTIAYDYNAEFLNQEEIEKLHRRILGMIHQIIEDEEIVLKQIETITPEEKHQILYDFNNTKVEYPKDKTIVDLFEQQVEKVPNHIAVQFEGMQLTYKELNEKANQLADILIKNNISDNATIGILLKRSINIYVCMLGILKANCNYILIDYKLPNDRIEYMLKNSNTNVLLTDSLIKKDISIRNTIYIDQIQFNTNINNINKTKGANSPACIIYTSGSTGTPKGVMITHQGIINVVISHENILHTDEIHNFLSMSTVAFDMFAVETYISLLSGGKVVLTSEKEQESPLRLQELIVNNHIEFILTTPSKIELLMMDEQKNCLKDVKIIQLGGEIFSSSLYKKLRKFTNANIYNGYGPTEITACCAIKKITSSDISIGRPFCNTKIFICDKTLNLLPIGTIGELCVSGDGISLGYIHNEELTNKSFVKSSFCNQIMYRTGDLAYWDNNGELRYVSRKDNQVKLRGLRIELNEIMVRIKEIPGVKNSHVMIKEINGSKAICAYISTHEQTDLEELEIKNYLKQYLPDYMIPTFIVFLDEMPLTINGKIDTRKLPNIIVEKTQIANASTETEIKLETICKKYLSSDSININSSLFDIGGDSLFAIKLVAEIYNHFSVTISVKEIFEHPTIKELSIYLLTLTKGNQKNTIRKVETAKYYPLSNAQKRIYYASSVDSNSTLYNTAGGIIIDKTLDITRLEKCFQELMNRHEVLRTHFEMIEDDIVQIVNDNMNFTLEREEQEAKDINKIYNDFVKPFDLNRAPLFRTKVVKLKDNKTLLLLDMHHIISDGTSLNILLQELCKLYNGEQLAEKQIDYKDFTLWEKEQTEKEEYKKTKEFWVDQYQDEVPLSNMPTTYTRPSVQSFEGANFYTKLPKEIYEKVNETAKKLKITPYMLLLSVYYILLSKYTMQDDIVIGTPVVGRELPELADMLGMFVNTLALRRKIDNKNSFEEFSKTVKEYCLEAFKNQAYPFDELVKELKIKKDASRNPVFDIAFIYQNNGYPKINLENAEAEYFIPENTVSKFDLSLEIIPIDNEYSLRYEYCTKLYSEEFIKRLGTHYEQILNQILENTEIKVEDIEIITQEEKEQILNEFNNTVMEYPREKTIVDLFEEQVEKSPENIALVLENEKLTYRELNEKANGLAKELIEKGIHEGDVVGSYLTRSLEWIISIFGILKAGAIYMPMFTGYPVDRLNYMLDNSQAKCFITTKELYENIETNTIPLFIDKNINSQDKNIEVHVEPTDLAYIIYTSGSTGRPKGVKIMHKNLMNFVHSFKRYYHGISEQDTFLASTNISFDVSIWEIFMPLLNGAKLVLNTEEIISDIHLYCKNIIEHKITALYIPPNILNEVYEVLSKNEMVNINKLLVGVEAIKKSTLNHYYNLNDNMIIVNGYGPTETTICATALSYKKDNSKDGIVSIGNPLKNNKIYMIDKDMHLCPIGIPGELCVAGEGVGKGYLNNEEETQKLFVQNPFDRENQILYKTGDLAKWNTDGTIDFIGRIDNQIKLSGYRIELNEINNCINGYKDINSVHTTLQKNSNKDYIVSYFTARQEINTEELTNYLKTKLPFYMLPQVFMQIPVFPLTPNGKIDTKRLPTPEIKKDDTYIAPETKTEKEVGKILEELLGIDKIGMTNNLFDIGMDSLVAIKLSVKIMEILNVSISVKEIFEYPTIKELSSYIEKQSKKDNKNKIKKVEVSEYYPASSAQKRIYYASSIEEGSVLYNIAGGIIVDKILDTQKLEKCFKDLIERHEALRTRFNIAENDIIQIIDDKIEFTLEIEEKDSDNIDEIYNGFIKPFDLKKAPLFRAKVVKIKNQKMLILLDMHHIISDGTSISILLQELCTLYNDGVLPEKQVDYKDFTLWEKEQAKKVEFKNQKEYWINRYQDEIPLLNMPTVFQRPSMQSFEGGNYYTKLPKEMYIKINEVANRLGITPYMLLLSIYYILLSKYTMQDDIVVGTPIIGRDLPELGDMLGMFVNTLALRNKINKEETFAEFASQIKENCLESFANQMYPFDELVKELNIKRDASRNPLFDVMFIYQNEGYPEIKLKDTQTEYYIPENNVSKFDLSLEMIPIGEELSLRYEYCAKLYDEEFIKRLALHYHEILKQILENTDMKIAEIQIITKEEKKQLLQDFNNTKEEYPREKTIVDLFEEQVEKAPNNIAVVFEDKQLTYQELNEKANQLARVLIQKGVSNDSIVGIMLPRSLEIMIAFLAVLKTGACYIPMDPTFPKERIDYMLEDSQATVLLKLSSIKGFEGKSILDIDIQNKEIYQDQADNLGISIHPDSPSYMIYTSGSTGKPKGVVLKHQSLMNLTCYLNNVVEYFKQEKQGLAIASITTISFDIFLFETIISLQKGLKVVIANETEQTNPKLLDELIAKHDIKAIQMTPSRMEVLMNHKEYMPHLSNLKYITLAGEALPDKLKNKILELGVIKIYNGYGPSETTVFSTFTDVTNYPKVNIGRPIANTYMYVLDKDKNLCPMGIPGELYISGEGVGKGYLNKEELQKKSFMPDIFRPEFMMYKTGDLVKILPNGELDYIGRADNQVKIRGLRIELDEIQKWMMQYKDINKVILSSRTDKKGRQYIVAYLTVDNRISINNLKIYLGKHIPKYMIPTYFMILDKFPYLPNGKIDKKSLPIPNENTMQNKKYVAPTNRTEIEIAQIFENLLAISPIGIEDNFFDIGGDSLLAMSLQLELLKIKINISYSDIFMYPTIKELAEHILSKTKQSMEKIDTKELDKFNTILDNTTKLPATIEKKEIGNLLLTGVTGFLGAHILDSFLKNEKGVVYCLIRNEPGLTIHQKLLGKLHYYFDEKYDDLVGNRIIPIQSDISIANLELEKKELQELADKVDVVINSAAKVSHYGNYGDYKKINVDGVQNLIDFCMKNGKRFYQISTLSVSGNSLVDDSYTKQSFENDIEFHENNFYINQSLENVYVRSKFEAEKLVLEAVTKGLDGYIIRVGNLMNRVEDGKFQQNVSENAFINRLMTYYKIGCIPDYLLNGYLELTPIDYCANAIIKIGQHNHTENRIFHLINQNNIDVKYFIDTLNQIYDKIGIVDNKIFLEAVDKILDNPNTRHILSGLLNDFDENRLIVYSSPIKIKSDFTIQYLNKIGFKWPELKEEYIKKFLKFFYDLNLLNKKGGN